MKKILVVFLFSIALIGSTNAQFTKVGGGLALTSGFPFHEQTFDANKSGVLGIYFKGIYKLSVPFHLAPSFTIFYPHITKVQTDKTTVSSMMFDLNGHWVFNSLDKFEFYGLAGIDILLAKKKEQYESSSPTFTEKDNALGLNLGVGTYMKLTNEFDLSGEIKYVFNNKYNQVMLNVGLLFNVDWMKKHEDTGL